MRIIDRINEARKLLEEKHYRSSIDEYGKVMQEVFQLLYKEYFPILLETDAEKVIDYRKQLGKQTDKFTIGEWIGLFRVAKLFEIIGKAKKEPNEKNFVFFTSNVIDAVTELRNRSTHSDEDFRYVSEEKVAAFVESAVLCMLRELKMISETDIVRHSILPRQASSTRKFSEVSREDILRASRDPEINSFKFINKYAEIEGAKYPVKGLLSLASDTSPSNFTTDAAARILGRLGFQVMEVQRQTSANHGKSFVHSEVSRILYHTKEEGILHMAITRIYSTVDQLVAETRMLYSAVDGVDTLTPEMACQIIRDAWKNNNRILMPFKNDAFRFYLERLLNDKLEQ